MNRGVPLKKIHFLARAEQIGPGFFYFSILFSRYFLMTPAASSQPLHTHAQ
nr:MAG TPA: hypothetical protein [Caudoviricetes sp.]